MTEEAHRITRFRHEESENALNRGIECMLLAEEDRYQNKDLLTEACDAFIDAIKFNRQNTPAYVGMAYLLWLLKDEKRALSYLEQGLRTNPSDPDVHALIKQISGTSVAASSANAQGPESGSAAAAVRAQVQELLDILTSERSKTISPSINNHMIERLQENVLDWELRYDDVLGAIDGLDTFHERVMLTCDLGPVQDRIIAYHKALKDSERMLKLDDQILENTRLARQYVEEIENSETGMFQAYIDVLLDNCEAIAESLDAFESESLNIKTLDSHYQQLADLVEELQDKVEVLT